MPAWYSWPRPGRDGAIGLDRAQGVQYWPRQCKSGPDLGPVNLANRSHATFVELSVKLCWNLSSGLPHSFCRTWWQPCGTFLEPYLISLAASWNSWKPKPTKQQCQAFTLSPTATRSDMPQSQHLPEHVSKSQNGESVLKAIGFGFA